ncbi:hypothetical protein TH66_05460 [Carbonactinospora thermoautotrophica]|uniref:Carrier domain-containing protein n=1 Tax=Carbonactinospora thermoautotrophica TaxID=1469144 RepID=A0A132N3K6_9ACTN|nr:acyl carrier protein [Carbonactinospora thermoautotrophica]KWX04664.1 hypothetical protein TH66_05460 [Carbonactinospora thermoautotrophica]KWX08156.1 hypothetical protein TR74_16240 [Carbonactinospora thermoautotrophica]
MAQFTLDDLKQIMRTSAGVDESVDLDGDIAHVAFADLGYDSLAVLEMQSRISQDLGIEIPDDALEHMKTPAEAVAYVNARLQAVA